MATKTKPAAPAPTKQQAPDNDGPPPTFRELLLEQLKTIRDALPEGSCPLEFADAHAIDYDALLSAASAGTYGGILRLADREKVTYAVAYLRGAHEAMDITMSEMLDNEGIDSLQLDTEH